MWEMLMVWLTTLPSPGRIWLRLTAGGPNVGAAMLGWLAIFPLVAVLVWLLVHRLLKALFPAAGPAAQGALFLLVFLTGLGAGAAAGLLTRPWLLGD